MVEFGMRTSERQRKFSLVVVTFISIITKIWSFTTLSSSTTNFRKPCPSRSTFSVAPLAAEFVRWKQQSTTSSTLQEWQLQTAVTSYKYNDTLLELHTMVHFGSPDYFGHFNHLDDSTTVVYELLVDENLLEQETSRSESEQQDGVGVQVPERRLRQPVDASVSDLQTAQAYGLTCQASVIDYCRSNFFHGDWTRQELLKAIDNDGSKANNNNNKHLQQPLWQQATGWSAGQEAVTALLVGPPILWVKNKQHRLDLSSISSTALYFRHVVHSRAIQLLRPLLWLTVPSPEISILLLDWSSFGVAADWTLGSPLSRAVLQSLASGDWDATRKLVFGQIILTTTMTATSSNGQEDWITQRNQRAIDVINQVKDHSKKMAVLYGSMHCDDLQQRLVDTGFEPVERRWRTAWSVPVPTMTPTRLLDPNLLKLLFLLVAYLGIGALDWIVTWADVTHTYAEAARSTEQTSEVLPDVLGEYALYLIRHLLLYVGLSKFVWNSKQT